MDVSYKSLPIGVSLRIKLRTRRKLALTLLCSLDLHSDVEGDFFGDVVSKEL